MRQPEKKRRTVGIRGQLMWFLCLICLLLLVLFWFLCTQLLEPLYTTHIQKQLTEQADAIVQKLDDAIADGQTLSYWGFGSQLYVNSQFFNQLSSEIYENGGMSSFCVDISDVTLRQIFKVENLSYCNLHRTRPTDENSELPSYSTARAMRQLCRETGSCVRKINPPTPSGTVELMVGRTTSDGSYTVLVTTSLMHVSEAGEVMSTVLPLAAALIFAFSMSAAWLFSEWFTKPLRQLSGAARQVAQGDYAVQVETNRRDELGDLAQEFNHMAKESPARGPDAARPAGKCLPRPAHPADPHQGLCGDGAGHHRRRQGPPGRADEHHRGRGRPADGAGLQRHGAEQGDQRRGKVREGPL